ncbi:MAG TPA: UMP kinase [Candidatus Nanoarchaeia archaeon]|nr:UMP kinase [Candidatus Nanoarchaeia archaeon]
MQKTFIISLGGSLIVPDKIDAVFLNKFKVLIEKYSKKGFKFVIICGGGKLARNLQAAASKVIKLSNEELDWIGIHATKLNASLLRHLFGKNVHDAIISNPNDKIKTKKSIIIASGWLPGWSTDFDAVLLAKNFKISNVVNMSNVDYVYDKDPRKFRNAKKIEHMKWDDMSKLIGTKWKAGMNAPFDPIAAKKAKQLKIKANIIGKDLKNLENLLNNRKFRGTVIE